MQCIPLRVHEPPFPRQTEAGVFFFFFYVGKRREIFQIKQGRDVNRVGNRPKMQKDQYMDPPMPYNFCIFAILLNFE